MTRNPKPLRFTKILFGRQVISVPWGFGQEYQRIATMFGAEPAATAESLLAVIELVGYTASLLEIRWWPFWEQVRLYAYCTTEHLRASDNPVQRHPRPGWLPDPWHSAAGDGQPTDLDRVRVPAVYVSLDWS